MLERGTLSILCTFQISSLTLCTLLPKLKVSVASKTELCNKNASETVCMHSLVMAQLSCQSISITAYGGKDEGQSTNVQNKVACRTGTSYCKKEIIYPSIRNDLSTDSGLYILNTEILHSTHCCFPNLQSFLFLA